MLLYFPKTHSRRAGDGDGGDDGGGGRIFPGGQPPSHHAQGYHIPFGKPLTPIYNLREFA